MGDCQRTGIPSRYIISCLMGWCILGEPGYVIEEPIMVADGGLQHGIEATKVKVNSVFHSSRVGK